MSRRCRWECNFEGAGYMAVTIFNRFDRKLLCVRGLAGYLHLERKIAAVRCMQFGLILFSQSSDCNHSSTNIDQFKPNSLLSFGPP